MSEARECVGCGGFVYPPEEVCKECAYILELEDRIERLRGAMLEASWALRHDIGREAIAARLDALREGTG